VIFNKGMKIFFVIIVFCISISSCKDFQDNNLKFEQNEWKKADVRIRGRMYRSLIEEKILLGKTRDEVIEILGEPEQTDPTFIKYAVDLGAIHERWLQKYFFFVFFDEQTQKVRATAIAD